MMAAMQLALFEAAVPVLHPCGRVMDPTNSTAPAAAAAALEMTPELAFAYTGMILMALVPIYIGSHLSLNKKKTEQTMKASDAWMFPVIASCFLFGLYIVFKYLNKEYVNMLLNAYFLFFGMASLLATFRPLWMKLYSFISNAPLTHWNVKFPWEDEPTEFNIMDLFNLAGCASLVGWYVMSKHWVVSNILGLCFSIQGIALLAIPKYSVACILLGGLFFYDIFWVFGTDVMVTVAKSFDAPIKLLMPKDVFAATYSFSMLGLGDIVIPGVFLALLLRYDSFRAGGKKSGFSQPYFTVGFIGYVLGLAATMFVMHTFRAAQPALLYLVPACIGCSFTTALVLGDVGGLLAYSEEEPEAEADGAKKKEENGKKEKPAADSKKAK